MNATTLSEKCRMDNGWMERNRNTGLPFLPFAYEPPEVNLPIDNPAPFIKPLRIIKADSAIGRYGNENA